MKDAIGMFIPTHAGARAKRLRDPRDRRKRAQSQFKRARQIGGTIFRSQREHLFSTQAEPIGLRVISVM